jgi:RecA-family ATPase
MSSTLRIYTGDDAFKMEKPNVALIEQVLFKDDIAMLFGDEKAGKSILAQQMAFCLTSQHPFLGKFKVPRAQNVVFFQTEGKDNEGAERRIRMEHAVPIDRAKYAHFYKKHFPLDLDTFKQYFIKALMSLPFNPDVLFFDALYSGMQGDLIDNKAARKFQENFSSVAEMFGLTGIIVHHAVKEQYDKDTKEPIERGDKGTYGSAAWRWWVDTILYLQRKGPKTRVFRCDTSRSGRVVEKENIVLIGNAKSHNPKEPLYFEISENFGTLPQTILGLLTARGKLTKDELKSMLNVADATLYSAMRQLKIDGYAREVSKGVYESCGK